MPTRGSRQRVLCALFAVTCSCFELGGSKPVAPPDTGIPSAPTQPAPTGTRWEGKEVTDGCGRKTIAWVLADEVCSGAERPDHLSSFRAPMFRDGALVGDRLFTVDATHLWVLDVADPTRVVRQALISGLGEPLALRSIENKLLVASAADGLVSLDLTDPTAPARTGALALPGPALDVYLEGGLAYVAMGKAGVAIVNVKAEAPTLVKSISLGQLPGAYAAGVTAKDGRIYVAACTSFVVLDAASGSILGHTWRADAEQDGILVAPAKAVALVDQVAFVAAGRFGAVAVDARDPSQPALLGNCTEPSDLSFYASGLRAAGQALYVAGGEWGIKSIPLASPAAACSTSVSPKLMGAPTESETDCSAKPPWTVMPWEELWAPPPPKKDPIQVLPAGDRLYAFGDARRVGTRAVDIRGSAGLALLGRYDEPRLCLGVAAAKGSVVSWGPGGGVFHRDEDKLLLPVASTAPTATATAGAVLPDGRWALLAGKALHVEGWTKPVPLPSDALANAIAVRSDQAIIPTRTGALLVDAKTGVMTTLSSGREAALPPSLAASETALVLAAPEWTAARSWNGGSWSELPAHGVFDAREILDLGSWQIALPRRQLVSTSDGVAELASLGEAAGLVLHPGESSLALPAATYSGMVHASSVLHVVSVDRGLYESQLLSIDLAGAKPSLLATEAFTGIATGIAADGDRLYVSDADRGVRVYKIAGKAAPVRLGTIAPEVKP